MRQSSTAEEVGGQLSAEPSLQREQADSDAIAHLGPEVLGRVEEAARVAAISVIRHESHVGPMPSPRDFALYDRVLPGTAQVIRDQFEENAKHTRGMQQTAVDYQKDDNDKNRRVAERLVWAALIASVVLALAGHDWVAGIMAASTVGAVIAGFLQRRSERQAGSRESDNANDENNVAGGPD